MTDIVFATHNKGKVHEVQHVLRLDTVKLHTLDDVGLAKLEVDETSPTYEGNALLKAKTIGDKTRKLAIADDSGIEVQALGNKPGVHSARYAKGSDTDRVQKLLKEMEGKENRKATFVCVIVLYDPETNMHHTFRGELHGTLTTQAMGENGFGYDPIFLPEGYHKTTAMLTTDEKNQISHRSKAIAQLREWLVSNLK